MEMKMNATGDRGRGINVPSIANSALAKGDVIAARALGKSELPTSITGFPG